MKPYLLLLLLPTAITFAGCDLTEDRGDCPTVGEVKLVFDWAQVPDGTAAPSDMSVHFYPKEGAAVSAKTDDQGGDFFLPRGQYSLLVFNEDGVAVTLRTNENGLDNNIVSVIKVAPPLTGAASTEPYIGQPRTLYSVADVSSDFFVEVGEKIEKTVQPENHIRQAKVVVRLLGDFSEVTACSFELTGLVQSLNLFNYAFEGEPATTAAPATRTEQGYSRLFTLLGKHPKTDSYLMAHIDCLSGTPYYFQVEVSEALAKLNQPSIFSTTITLDIEVYDRHELGFELKLADWEYVMGGNLDVNFNE